MSIHVFEALDCHHVSLILIVRVCLQSTGVKIVFKAFALSVHAHPSYEYWTDVLGEGHVVSFILQVTLEVELLHISSGKLLVHVSTGVQGIDISFFIVNVLESVDPQVSAICIIIVCVHSVGVNV